MSSVVTARPISTEEILEQADLAAFFERGLNIQARPDSPSRSFPDAKITKLTDTLEIKQRWLHSEWDKRCQFSQGIKPFFPERSELSPHAPTPDIQKIQSVFHQVRGRWRLWQAPREEAKWTKIETDLTLDWAEKNVEVLFPTSDHFPVSELDGVVLWDEGPAEGRKRYQLYEGNHRFSAWLASRSPTHLPAVCFVGQPKD